MSGELGMKEATFVRPGLLMEIPGITQVDREVVAKAQAKLAERKRKAKMKVVRDVFRAIGFLLALAGMVWFGVNWCLGQVTKGYLTDIRKCSVTIGEDTIQGERSYSYVYQSLFGFRLIDESRILEDTKLNMDGTKLTVVGIGEDDSWWRYNFDTGEVGPKPFKPAKTYIFMTAKNTVVMPYKKFCQ